MKKLVVIASTGIIALSSLVATHLALAKSPIPPQVLASENSLAPMLQKVMPAVVNIIVQGELPSITDPFLKRELQKRGNGSLQIDGNKFVSLGSGVIINADKGYIVTNAHVISEAANILVTLSDGRRFLAKKIGVDNDYDVAVIQIQAHNLTALPLSNSTTARVGDFVAAIGSPFGLNQTVTSGIVSALHRSDLGLEGFENFIQTDAPINVGNSGGALVNMQGQLIGINTAIVAPSGGSIGIGFAIPTNIVQSIVEQLIQYGKVQRGMLGVQVQTLAPDLAQAFGLSNQTGAVVTAVIPYSPAAKAGLKPGDVIVGLDNTDITSSSQIHNMVGLMRTGADINLKVLRAGKPLTLTATITSAQDSDVKLRMANPYLYGVTTRDIVADNPAYGEIRGVQVLSVDYSTPASISDLTPGDIITTANGQAVKNVSDLENIAQHSKSGLLLLVLRGNGSFFVLIQ
jgi:serine protease Do